VGSIVRQLVPGVLLGLLNLSVCIKASSELLTKPVIFVKLSRESILVLGRRFSRQVVGSVECRVYQLHVGAALPIVRLLLRNLVESATSQTS